MVSQMNLYLGPVAEFGLVSNLEVEGEKFESRVQGTLALR
jgi:hypothetical protein